MKALSSIALYLSALVVTLGLGACSSSSDAPASTFSVVRSSYDSSPEASSGTIVVSEPGFEVSTDASWLTATVQNGTEVQVGLEANTSSESRTASVVLTKSGTTLRVPFTQMGVQNSVAGLTSTMSYNRKGGSSSYALSGPDQVQVTIPATAQSWLSQSVVDGQLVLTCSPLATDQVDVKRTATITIAKGVYYKTMTISQEWGGILYEDLLGEYTLSYSTWKDNQVLTATVSLATKTEGRTYLLTGLAADVELSFNERTTTLTLSPQDVANRAAYLGGWMADGRGTFRRSNWTLTGTWDQNKLTPKFTFASSDVITNDGTDHPIIGFIFWRNSGGEYTGSGISRVVQFSITKK